MPPGSAAGTGDAASRGARREGSSSVSDRATSPTVAEDAALARELADATGAAAARRCATTPRRAATGSTAGTPRRTTSSSARSPATGPRTRCSPRRAPRTPRRAGGRTGSGSSTRSTAPAATAAAGTSGACTSPSWSTARSSPARWPCPPAASWPTPPPSRRCPTPPSTPSAGLTVTVSRSRPAGGAAPARGGLPGADGRDVAAGVKTLAVVDGLVDAYLHSGGQYEWDNAAPAAVAEGAGRARHPPRRVARCPSAPTTRTPPTCSSPGPPCTRRSWTSCSAGSGRLVASV